MAAMRKTGRSLHWWLMSQLRTFRSFNFRASLTQHPFARATRSSLCRSGCRQTGRSGAPIVPEPRPNFRRTLRQYERCGTFPPDANAAKLTNARRSNLGVCRGGAPSFPETGRSKLSKWPKSEPDVRCADFGCLPVPLASWSFLHRSPAGCRLCIVR